MRDWAVAWSISLPPELWPGLDVWVARSVGNGEAPDEEHPRTGFRQSNRAGFQRGSQFFVIALNQSGKHV